MDLECVEHDEKFGLEGACSCRFSSKPEVNNYRKSLVLENEIPNFSLDQLHIFPEEIQYKEIKL